MTQVIKQESAFSGMAAFQEAEKLATVLSNSTVVPKEYQKNIPNCIVALEMANRIGTSVLLVMQNVDIIQGRPSWKSTFIIGCINGCGKFEQLRFIYQKLGEKKVQYTYDDWTGGQKTTKNATITIDDISCHAVTTEKHNNKTIYGPTISIETAVKEGWYTKSGSKWPNMPELMLSYRAAAFFGRLYVPDILMGMHTGDEMSDMSSAKTEEGSAIVVESNVNKPLNDLDEQLRKNKETPKPTEVKLDITPPEAKPKPMEKLPVVSNNVEDLATEHGV